MHVDVRERALDARQALLVARRNDGTLWRSMLAYRYKGAVPGLRVHRRGDEVPGGVLDVCCALRRP